MTRLYEPVDLEAQKEVLEEAQKEPSIDYEKLEKAIIAVEKEINLIEMGVSSLTVNAIRDSRLPSIEVLNRLSKTKMVNDVEVFARLASQDFGAKAGEHFKKLLEEAIIHG